MAKSQRNLAISLFLPYADTPPGSPCGDRCSPTHFSNALRLHLIIYILMLRILKMKDRKLIHKEKHKNELRSV